MSLQGRGLCRLGNKVPHSLKGIQHGDQSCPSTPPDMGSPQAPDSMEPLAGLELTVPGSEGQAVGALM